MEKKAFFIFKKLLFFLFIITIIILCIISVQLMYKSEDKYSINIERSDIQTIQYSADDIYIAEKENLQIKLKITGTVAPCTNDAYTNIEFKTNVDGIELLASSGQNIHPDAPYANIWDIPRYIDHTMRFQNIEWHEDGCVFHFLDYNKLYVEAEIPIKYLQYDLYSYDYAGIINNEKFLLKMSYEDCFVQNDSVKVRFDFDTIQTSILPGTSLLIETIVEEKADVILIPTNYVIVNNDKHFVQIITAEDELKMVEVFLGELSDDSIEIISGLKEGDQIILPAENMSLANQMEDK